MAQVVLSEVYYSEESGTLFFEGTVDGVAVHGGVEVKSVPSEAEFAGMLRVWVEENLKHITAAKRTGCSALEATYDLEVSGHG